MRGCKKGRRIAGAIRDLMGFGRLSLVNKGQLWTNLGAVAAVLVAFAVIFVKNAPGNTKD
jgi:hypothetical protein